MPIPFRPLLLLALTTQTATQTAPAPPPKLTPAAAYREAIQPVELTHRAIGNWSQIEQASLAVAIRNATAACADRKSSDYTGEQLLDLAQLCALGLNWPAVLESTDLYTRLPPPQPRIIDAWAARVDAWLNLKNEQAALADAQKLLTLSPYTPIAAQASSEAIDYMRFLFPADALTLATARNQLILTQIEPQIPNPSIPLPDLHRQLLVLPELQQLQADPQSAAQALATLTAALPTTLTPDDTIVLTAQRSRYALLGQPLPPVPGLKPLLPTQITALLLFPDWCAQCIRLALQIPQGPFAVQGQTARMFPILVQTVPAKSPPASTKATTEAFNPAFAADYLASVSPLLATPALLDTFHTTDFPVLILVDRQGTIRYMDAIDENALNPGNLVDSAIAYLGHPPTLKRQPPAHQPSPSHETLPAHD